MLTSLTFTGADESVDPAQLMNIAKEYPFVEFGILSAVTGFSKPRYPGPEWLRELAGLKRRFPDNKLRLSLHLCKQAAINVDSHNPHPFGDLWWFEPYVDRIQLNLTDLDSYHVDSILEFMLGRPDKPIIIQQRNLVENGYDSPLNTLKNKAFNYGLKLHVLFDQSGGRGMVPERWPAPDGRFFSVTRAGSPIRI